MSGTAKTTRGDQMNKKVLGASVRKGVLTGTMAGFVAGWMAFAGHAKQFEVAEANATDQVNSTAADMLLPAVPALPGLGAVAQPGSYRTSYGFTQPMPRIQFPARAGAAAPAATAPKTNSPAAAAPAAAQPAPAAAPAYVPPAAPAYVPPPAPVAPPPPAATAAPLPVVTFAPLPPPPPAPKPKPTTAPSAPWP